MFTRNYYKYIGDYLAYGTQTKLKEKGYLTYHDGTTGVDLYSEATVLLSRGNFYLYSYLEYPRNIDMSKLGVGTSGSELFGFGVAFADGTEQPTVDDYWFSGNTLSGLTFSQSLSKNVSPDLNYMEIICVYTITNNNTSDITIGEVGLVDESRHRNTTSSSTGYYHYGVLLERTVLDVPVTIPAGGVGQVAYAIRFNYPTA